jgi:hypothetical protein
MMADNWYLVLELEFYPNPTMDYDLIEKRIAEKTTEWSNNRNHPEYGPNYKRYKNMIPEIKTAMGNPATRRKLIEDACRLTYGPIDKMLLMVAGDAKEISAKNISDIAKQYQQPVGIVERRAREECGIRIVRELTDQEIQELYDTYGHCKPNYNFKKRFDDHPLSLQFFPPADTLYDFLSQNTTTSYDRKSSCEDLCARAKERRKEFQDKHGDTETHGGRLCSDCDGIGGAFKDKNSKAVYDRYLEYKKSAPILDRAKKAADMSSSKLSGTAVSACLDDLEGAFKDKQLAADILFAFCKIEGITAERSKDSSKKANHDKREHGRSAAFQNWYDKAKKHLESKEFDLARTAVKEALSRFDQNSENPEFFCMAAAVYKENRDYSAALDYINKAILCESDNCAYYLEKFDILDKEEASLRSQALPDKRQRIDKVVEDEISVLETAAQKANQHGDKNTLASAYEMLSRVWYYTKSNIAVAEGYAKKALEIDISRPIANKIMKAIAAAKADQKAREDAEKELRRQGEVRSYNNNISNEIALIDRELRSGSFGLGGIGGISHIIVNRIMKAVSGVPLFALGFYMMFFNPDDSSFAPGELIDLITNPNANKWTGFIFALVLLVCGLLLAILPGRKQREWQKRKHQIKVLRRRRNELQHSFRQ